MDAVTCTSHIRIPKLRRSRRIENRWGVKYHAALKNAVFTVQKPYIPLEPPPSLKDYAPDPDTLYVCAQCKDCFHFQSSFEDHNTRKSWILGYWCQPCFLTICSHMSTKGTACFDCAQLDRDKRSYLRSKGLHKNHKYGAVRIFYNQCQFFAHLQSHNLCTVDMADLMLMPLPTNIGSEWNPKVEFACEALVEHAFILRVHIMDWLKEKQIDNNWWQLAADKTATTNDAVSLVMKCYMGRVYFKAVATAMERQLSVLNNLNSTCKKSNMLPDVEMNEPMGSCNKRKTTCTDTTASISDESVTENEDNPCTVNDIAFVDCGPASNYFEPEIPVNNVLRKHTTIFVKSVHDSTTIFQPASIRIGSKSKKYKTPIANCASSDMAVSYGNTTITPKLDTNNSAMCNSDKNIWKSKTPIKIINESNITKKESDNNINKTISEVSSCIEPLPSTHSDVSSYTTKGHTTKQEKSNASVQSLATKSNPKVLTFQSSKTVDIREIISQLPPHIVNSKRIVFIGQDPDGVAIHTKQESSPKKMIPLVPDTSHGEGSKNMQTKMITLRMPGDSSKDSTAKVIVKPQSDVGSNRTRQSAVSGNVVYQNGRQYIVKHSSHAIKKPMGMANVSTKDSQATKQSVSENIPTLIPLRPSDSESNSIDKTAIIQADVSPLTPSPPPLELSSSSSCDVQSKQPSTTAKLVHEVPSPTNNKCTDSANEAHESLSFHKGDDENLYLDIKYLNQKRSQAIVDTCSMITKSKQEMLNEFFHLSYTELKKRHDHLQSINEEILNFLTFVNEDVVKQNLKAVNILQHVLKYCIDRCNEKCEDPSVEDTPLNEWESAYECVKKKSVCKSCSKIMKPKSYIPGFSKPAQDESIYCSCYRYVCHKCLTYQSNSTRFLAHQLFHVKERNLCPDCYRRFATYKSLEVHMWTVCFHTLKQRVLGCRICEIDGFRDMESITRHFAIMHSNNKIACDVCYMVLPSYSEYTKHRKEAHITTEKQEPIRLVLCKLGRCIVRYEDYMLHMQKHLVVQRLVWFKCPFCMNSHFEVKEIMSHIQNEHLDSLPEIISLEALCMILPKQYNQLLAKKNPHIMKYVHARVTTYEDKTVLPKIINTRTITSEVFERGAQEIEDDLANNATNPVSSKSPLKNASKSSENVVTEFLNDTELPSDIDIKPELFDTLIPETTKADTLPKILDVRSIANTTKDTKVEEENSNENAHKLATEDGTLDEAKPKMEEGKPVEGLKEEENEEEVEEEKVKCPAEIVKDGANDALPATDKSETNATPNNSTSMSNYTSPPVNIINQDKQDCVKDTCNETKMNAEGAKECPDSSNVVQTNDEIEDKQGISMLKPPPLARIPLHMLEQPTPQKSEVQRSGKERGTVPLRNPKTNRKSPWRIALSAPNASTEKILNFSCHLCGVLINTSWSVISRHFKEKHSDDCKLSVVSPRLLRISPDFINGGYKDLFASRKRKSDALPSTSKRRRRWTPKKYSESKNTPGLGLCVQQETAEDGEGNFRCKKCNQRCADMPDLREHIASNHRIKGRYLICLECGENFVVVPSLQMHLKAFHGIEDPITYMTRNTSYAPDSVDDLDEGKIIEANQCHVCMAVFEDKAAVDKHLRVHGMAFLNRKRIEARNALKSPEKRSDEEEKQNVTNSPEPLRKEKPAETILEKINATI